MKTFIENGIKWTKNYEFYLEWKRFPMHFEILTWELDKHNGHICILNFALYWHTEGESLIVAKIKTRKRRKKNAKRTSKKTIK